ncbi:MAG: hypothetical protein RLZZ256_733, partial [Bacteroidota bacterium]
MATHFHALPIRSIQAETVDCISVEIEVPKDLQTEFKYLPGQ